MKLFLVRHGETDWNVQKKIQGKTDIELNELGVTQARRLGEKIAKAGTRIDKIYSSRLKRAYKTAVVIGECIHSEVEVVDGLEEMHLGDWEGMRWSEVRECYPEAYQKWYENRRYERVPNGESYQDLLERVLHALHIIIEKEENALIVTHSADIVTLLAMIHETPFHQMFDTYKIGNADLIEIECSDIQKVRV